MAEHQASPGRPKGPDPPRGDASAASKGAIPGKPAEWRRWLGIVLRASHLAAVIALGAALLGAPLGTLPAAATVLASGIALLAVETLDARMRWRELAGLVSLLKLAAVAWMALAPDDALQAFWIVLFVSALVSHAPRRVRHWRPGRPSS